jgi:hypothetical protein
MRIEPVKWGVWEIDLVVYPKMRKIILSKKIGPRNERLISAGLVQLCLFLTIIGVRPDFFSVSIIITVVIQHNEIAFSGLMLRPGIAGFPRAAHLPVVRGWPIVVVRRIPLRCLIGRRGRSLLNFSNIDRSWRVSLDRNIDTTANILLLELGSSICGGHLWKSFTYRTSENFFRATFTFVFLVAKHCGSLSF